MIALHDDHAKNIRRCFNRAALTYDQNCQIQFTVGESLIQKLAVLQPYTNHIIDYGCGTGLVTAQLAMRFPYQHFYAIDIAERLLIQAQNRLENYGIQCLRNDFQSWQNRSINFNLVFSNLALHWSFDLKTILAAIYNCLVPQGLLAFSIPLAGTFDELKNITKNHFFEPIIIRQMLEEIGFNEIDFSEETIQKNFESIISAIKAIKAIGANYTKNKIYQGLRGKNFMHNLWQEPVLLTYQVGYFIASKI